MHRVAAAMLAIPVLAVVYVATAARRSTLPRIALPTGLAVVAGALFLAGPPTARPTTASVPTVNVPLTRAAFTTDLHTDQAPRAPVTLRFSTPMNPQSVAAHLEIDPPTPVELAWDDDHRTLTLEPVTTWETARFHTITVQPGALAQTGRPLSTVVRAAFLTRPATGGRIAPSALAGEDATLETSFVIEFDRPVDPASMIGALVVEPPVEGILAPAADGLGDRWTFRPAAPLEPDTVYSLSLVTGVRDADGAPLRELVTLSVRTAGVPRVVRFRPRDGQKEIERGATLSVRFTEPMDRVPTRVAFTVTADGEPVDGKISWAEGDTVLVFDPAASFGYGQTVVMTVGPGARSAAGVPIAGEVKGTFTSVPKPAPPAPKPASTPPSGGGSVGSGTWAAVETYYLGLMNCTRTGGWVSSSGSCSGAGTRGVAPLSLDGGISSSVSRPYAQLLATRNLCSHYIGGSPGDRLRRAGYTSYTWAENLGCRSGDPYAAVLGSHLYFQSEKSYNGGHYVNMMSTKYDRAGIGVWVSAGRVRLVVNFYRP